MNLERLKQIRKSKGFTQAKMAELLGYNGKSGYCQLENGTVKMTLDKARKIAEILGKDVESIFFNNKVHAGRTSNNPPKTKVG